MELTQTTLEILDRWTSLRSKMAGNIITPQDPQYDQARLAWNRVVDQYPAVIVQPVDTTDVVTAVTFAQQNGLGIAVQATGHGNVRPANDAMLILTSAMQAVRINSEAQTAWVSAGAKWAPVLKKAQAVGLAPLLGSTPNVGAVGYTLGGGFGWLGRKYGLSLDNVNCFEVVTAAGEVRLASSTQNDDLFWGLRGGGGSLAVVTGMEIQLHPITMVYGGNLYYPIEFAKELFTRYRNWIQTAPDELTSSILVMNYPPIPEIPDFLRGQTFAQVRGCYCGPLEQGEALLRIFREWRTPIVDDFKPMPFSDVALISNDPLEPMPGLTSSVWIRELDDHTIDTLIAYGSGTNGSPLIFAEVRHAGGAIARTKPDSTAYGNRDASHLLQVVGLTPTKESYHEMQQFCQRMFKALSPSLNKGAYLNFLEGVEAQTRIKEGYSPQTYERLRALKARFDPENRLGYSFNILPTEKEV